MRHFVQRGAADQGLGGLRRHQPCGESIAENSFQAKHDRLR